MSPTAFDRTFAILATVAVAAGAVAGFWILGSPSQQRLILGDQQRLEDLSAIASSLHWNYQNEESYSLPDTLEPNLQRQDPITQAAYGYNKLDDSNYQLCANFSTDSSTYKLASVTDANWQHPQGLHCFKFNLEQQPPSLY